MLTEGVLKIGNKKYDLGHCERSIYDVRVNQKLNPYTNIRNCLKIIPHSESLDFLYSVRDLARERLDDYTWKRNYRTLFNQANKLIKEYENDAQLPLL